MLIDVEATKAHTIEIFSEGGRSLLRLNRVDGRLVADYDPADLDEAAQQFVRAVERITAGHTTGCVFCR